MSESRFLRIVVLILGVLMACPRNSYAREIVYVPSDPIYLHGNDDPAASIKSAIATSKSISWEIDPKDIPFLTGSSVAKDWVDGNATVLFLAEPFSCFMSFHNRGIVIEGKIQKLSGFKALNYLKANLAPRKDGCRLRIIGFEKYLLAYPSELWFGDPKRAVLVEAVPAPIKSNGVIYSQDRQINARLVFFDLNRMEGSVSKVAKAGLYEIDGRVICEGKRTIRNAEKSESGSSFLISGDIAFECASERKVAALFTQEIIFGTGQAVTRIELKGGVRADGTSYFGVVRGHSLMMSSFMETENGKRLVEQLESKIRDVRKSLIPKLGAGLQFQDSKHGQFQEAGKKIFSFSWSVKNVEDDLRKVPPTVLDFVAADREIIRTQLVDAGGATIKPGDSMQYSVEVPAPTKTPRTIKLRFVSEDEARKLRQ